MRPTNMQKTSFPQQVGSSKTSEYQQAIPHKKHPVKYAFMYCRSPSTQRQYPKRLKLFFDFIQVEGADLEEQGQNFLDKARQDPEWASQSIMTYLDYHRQRVLKKEISAGTLKTLWRPLKTFTAAYDDIADSIKWKRISKAMPRAKEYSNDRIPTIEELRRLVEYPDRRIKAIVYTMCSSGIRIGAWDYLRWKHVTAITNDKTGETIAAKLTVYAGEPEEYMTFCTPEAYKAMKDWMDFRKMYGEDVRGDSWVMRNMFAVADLKRENRTSKKGGRAAKITNVKRLENKAISRLLIRALYEQGLRETLEDGEHRHEFKAAHGFRKYFKTKSEQVMNRLNVEFLLGHAIGLNSNYYRPTQQELLQDYLKAVESLTINESKDITILREQQEVLEKRTQEKDNEVELLKSKINALEREKEHERGQSKNELEDMKKTLQQVKQEQATFRANTRNIMKYTMQLEIFLDQLKKAGVIKGGWADPPPIIVGGVQAPKEEEETDAKKKRTGTETF
jgi:integrase